jgi:hypothetical protein
MGIATDRPQRHGIHQREGPPHQFGERVIRVIGGIAAEQFGIVGHVGHALEHPPPEKPRRKTPRPRPSLGRRPTFTPQPADPRPPP